ncbi:MAG TPA: hypothetical protein VHL85_13400 [Burkholderiales bacterium]|jgi:hypothetical protein|nr:hypothetical protein [Burkholderiales bacterium]
MNVLTQQRWFLSMVAILSEVPSVLNDAALQLGRWLGASSKEADARIAAGAVTAAIALAVTVVLVIALAAGR